MKRPETNRLRWTLQALPASLAFGLGLIWFVTPPPQQPVSWIAFAVAAVIGELIVLENLRGQDVPTSVAVLGAMAILGSSPWVVAGVAVVAWVVAAAIRHTRGEEVRLPDLAHRLVAGWSLAGLAALGYLLGPALTIGAGDEAIYFLAILTVGAGLLVGPPLWEASRTVARDGGDIRQLVVGQVESTWGAALVLASSAALTALAYRVLGFGALVLMLLPVLAARAGLHRYTDIRKTYDQTIAAMSRMSELTGHVHDGHGLRVGDLSVSVARELGLPEREVAMVLRAAHLHEVGRITTDDPDTMADDREVAIVGAAIVEEAGSMGGVAEIVARHRDPYRYPGTGEDRTLPLACRIIRTVCEFEKTAGDGWRRRTVALDQIHRGMAFDHDPLIVYALGRVLERRGVGS